MKTRLLIALLVGLTGILQAQTLQWSYPIIATPGMTSSGIMYDPGASTSTLLSASASASDCLGGGAFVFQEINSANSNYTNIRVIWINRLGKLVMDSDLSPTNSFKIPAVIGTDASHETSSSDAVIMKLTTSELVLFVNSYWAKTINYQYIQSITQQYAVHFVISGKTIKRTDVPMSQTAMASFQRTTNDPNGFFAVEQVNGVASITRYKFAIPK